MKTSAFEMTAFYSPSENLSTVGDYWALLKPRVISLVVFTGWVGLMLAPGHLHPLLAFTAIFCIAVGAGAAGAINMWYDRDIDAHMVRTRLRPLPAGRILPGDALGFGVLLACASVLVMGLAINLLASLLLLGAIGFYVFIYTLWLKRRTPQNIVIGGAAGALPPVIGWVAVTGQMAWEPWILFMIIFFWTPPHFWSLALMRQEDYAQVGVPMLPVVSGLLKTKRHILLYAFVLVIISFWPYFFGFLGKTYGVIAACFGGYFLFLCGRLWWQEAHQSALRTFGFSIFYLFSLFLGMIIDRMGIF